ncbi:hypothetical protein B0H16DRAFT_510402 [Mycena metata]|uniref:F-box domain-containing protein n=1 Tax=Mycena metata TaxID=1033252 RepID=A0AAD7MFP0_9AGAR|nr:hypothetical protein B0H16DRAFT_510402 [Mycena metata]
MHASVVVALALWTLVLRVHAATHLSNALVAASVGPTQSGLVVDGASHANFFLEGGIFKLFSPFDFLPLELVLRILIFACGGYRAGRLAFLRTRRYIAHTCHLWRSIVESVSHFWRTLDVTPHLRISEVRHWISHWSTARLDLKLKFDDLYSLRYVPSSAGPPRMYPQHTIAVFAPYFARCARLTLVLEDAHALPDVLDRLRRTRADHLVELSITRITLPLQSAPLARTVSRPRRLFANSAPQELGRLRADGVSVGWGDLRLFTNLYDLILLNLLYPVNMATIQFYRLLFRAAQLCRLCVKRVSCEELLVLPVPPIHLPLLRVLDLHLDGSLGVSCVLSHCIAPALTSLSVYLPSDDELYLLLHCASAMSSVTTLSVNGSLTDVFAASRLYALLPRLVHLDLTRATPGYCEALYDGRRQDPHLCPVLEELRVISVPLSLLRSILELRAAASRPVRRLVMYRVYDMVETDDDLDWYLQEYSDGDILIDPPVLSLPSWTADV